MTCHFVFPFSWEECLTEDGCFSVVHHDDLPEVLNSYPQEWVETFFGFVVKNGERIEYRNGDGELHREDGPAVETVEGVKIWYRKGFILKTARR